MGWFPPTAILSNKNDSTNLNDVPIAPALNAHVLCPGLKSWRNKLMRLKVANISPL